MLSALFAETDAAGLTHVPEPELAVRMFVGPLLSYVLADGLLTPGRAPQPPSDATISTLVDLYLRTVLVNG